MKGKRWLAGVLTCAMLLTMVCLPAEAGEITGDTINGELILYSSFDEADMDGTTVKDLSGNGHDGTVVGELEFAPGILGNAVVFDGAANGGDNADANRYVKYGASAQILPGTGNFAVALWFKSTGTSNNGAIISNKNYYSGSNRGITIGAFTSDLRINFSATGNSRKELKNNYTVPKDGNWHHLAVNYDRSGSMTFYLDGASAGSITISDTPDTIDAGLEFVLGAGGNFQNGMTNCLMDELRIYGGVLPVDTIQALYNEGAGMARIAERRAALAAMTPNIVFPRERIAAAIAVLDSILSQLAVPGLTAEAIQALVKEGEEAYQLFANGEKPLASFHVISDVHVGGGVHDSRIADYITAMEDMKTTNAGTTIAFVNGGDFTQSTTTDQYTGFYTATRENNPVSDAKTLILLGNHDVRGADSGKWNKDPTKPELCDYWDTAKELYKTNNAPYMPDCAQETLYHSKTLGTSGLDENGYTFIMLNTELGLKDAMYMSPQQIQWFEQTMREAYERDPSKPIFIISHQALNDTHWRSNTLDGFDGYGQAYQTGADAKVKEIMAQYPNGVFLSGHIHNGFGVAQVIPREYGVTVDVPSFIAADAGNGSSDVGCGYEVEIFEGYVAFRARNFISGEWMPEYDVVVPIGEDGYAAKAQRAEDVLSNPLYYPESDVAKVKAASQTFMELLNQYYDQTGISYVEPAPSSLLYGAATHAALAEEAVKADASLAGVTRLETPRRDTYEVLRENWRSYLLGGTGDDLDLANPAVLAYVETLNTTAAEHWNTMVKSSDPARDDLWPDLDMTPINDYSAAAYTRSGNMAATFTRLRFIAQAWGTVGTDFYHNDYVRNELIRAMDYMVGKYFPYGQRGYGNWYHWEITAPTALGNLVMVLYDELTPAQVETYAKAMQWYAPYCTKGGPNSNGPAMTGGNLLLKANAVAQAGILLEEESMLENVKEGVKTVLVNNPYTKLTTSDADGFYADGSYIQHQALAYIGGYGADLFNNLGVFLKTLNGSAWELRYDDQSENVAYDFVFNGIEPFVYETRTMDMVSSRDVTRSGSWDRERSAELLSAILPLRGTFPTEEQNARFDSMMKYLLSLDAEYYYAHMPSITSIQIAEELVNDASVQPRSEYAITKTFAMDKTVHIIQKFGFAVSMHSSRTYGHELINSEGKRTWNTSDGMFYLYDADEEQYGGGYWATVDPTRLPGITAEHLVFNDGTGDRTKNIYTWTGGASIDSFGAAGTHMRTLGQANSSTRSGTDVKKSYFMFDDRIVMMGSDITSSTGNGVETIVDNRKLLQDGSNVVTVDGKTPALTDSPAEFSPAWMHVTGNVAGADVGYYFPEESTVKAIKEERTGDWSAQGATSGTETNYFATLWFDHGVKPSGASYEYVLLPGRTAAETAAFAADPDVEILRNDSAVHAARDIKNDVVAANFWEDAEATVAGITVDKAASVVMERKGAAVKLAVSDPTQKDRVITVSLGAPGTVIGCDANITLLQSEPFVKFSVDTAALGGAGSVITLELAHTEQLELVGAVTKVGNLSVELGTAFHELPLPETAVFLANDLQEHTLSVSWRRNGYTANAAGDYTVIGIPVLDENFSNSAGVELRAVVRVGGGLEEFAESDTYVQDGTTANTVMGGNSATFPVKLDASGYYRKGILRVSLAKIPVDAETITFNLQLGTPVDSGFQGAALYQVGNGWSQDTVTWNTLPGYTTGTPAATFTPQDPAADGIVRLDVTAVVKAALLAGEEKISFVLEATGTKNSKNQLTVYSVDSDALQRPSLTWSIAPAGGVVDKENLAMLVELAESLDTGRFMNFSSARLDAAVAAARLVLEDEGATMNDVNDAEDALMLFLLALRAKPAPLS
ncbi:MAG TPA: polysaccharide lyase family 8 super-sandwich domain-containing protein [Pseudoflavonifractor sp.]|nr:polysaccharide lyase family 8 super-sandwich domain-containing protein [Pseudoflavonifractor sp.]